MQKTTLLILATTIAIFAGACRKSPLDGKEKIMEYADNLTGPDAELFKIRGCLAKTVAKAMEDKEFRKFFQDFSGNATENHHFRELLITQHLEAPVKKDGTTLRKILTDAQDDEVKDIFGDELLQKVIESDPCVVLKLPDIFRGFTWDTDDLIPMITTVTPRPSLTFDAWYKLITFFYNGRHELTEEARDYFYCSLRYSEDYFLMDTISLENEKGISIYEILPQAQYTPDGMQSEMMHLGLSAPEHPGHMFIPRLKLFEEWRSKYSFKDPFLSESINCSNPDCIRECIPLDKSVMVLDSTGITEAIGLEFLGNKFLEESYTFSYVFWSRRDSLLLRQFKIPGLPFEYFENRDIEITLLEKDKCKPPRIRYKKTDLGTGKFIKIGGLINDFVETNEFIEYRIDLQVYSDQVNTEPLAHPAHPVQPPTNSSYSVLSQINAFKGCDSPSSAPSGAETTKFNY